MRYRDAAADARGPEILAALQHLVQHALRLLVEREKAVNFFFLIVAPPLEVSNQYLPVLGKIAQFSKEPDVPQRLLGLTEPAQFLELLKEKGV